MTSIRRDGSGRSTCTWATSSSGANTAKTATINVDVAAVIRYM